MKDIKKRNYHAIITGISAVIVCAYLTYIFMYNLGLPVGPPIAIGLVGFALQQCA